MPESIKLFDINITNITMIEAIDTIINLVKTNQRGYVVTPNVDHIVKLQQDKRLKEIYEHATLVLADGMPIVWASHLLGKPLVEKVSGSDLFTEFAPHAAREKIKLFFLGANPGVAQRAKEKLCEQYPGLEVCGIYSPPYGFEKDDQENQRIIEMINQSGAQVLFVGVGAPKQEYWIYNHVDKLKNVNVCLGIGASFDFVAGSVERAPKWMQQSGLEWFYRLMKEPKRMWKRYLVEDARFLPIFMGEFNRTIEAALEQTESAIRQNTP